MKGVEKALVILSGEIRTPPLSLAARRVIYRVDPDAVLIVGMFRKNTERTPKRTIEQARRLLSLYDTEVD